MSKIELSEVSTLAGINANFQKVEDEFNNKILYRDVPVGEPNNMEQPLDMNEYRIYNLGEPTSLNNAARLQDVVNGIAGASVANLVQFTPSGTIAADTVQGAIEELDAETQAQFANVRYVTTIADLKAVDSTKTSLVYVKAYFTIGDCDGRWYRLDGADNVTADNGGTVIVATDTKRWKLILNGPILNARAFGVIPGLADVSAALNKALLDHVGKYKLLLPWGTLNCLSVIDFPSGTDCEGVGPVNSSYGPIISQAPHGTKIVSSVSNAYAARINFNAPFVVGGENVGNFELTNTVGKGLYCQSVGTGGIIHDIGIYNCLQEGAHFDYFQDSTLANLEVVFCGQDTSYAVTFDVNCNACRVDKLLIVGCRQPLLVKDSTFFDFYNPHIEMGEYPGPPNDVVNRAYIAGGFKFQNCQHINVYGGVFVPNSTGYLATFYSIAESATPFFLVTDANCKNIKMFGPKFSSPLNGSRFMSVTNVELIGPTFNGAVSKINSIEGTNLKIRDGQAELYDDQTQTVMTFAFLAGRSVISDFEIICSNPSSTNKVSGILIDGAGETGNYKVTVDKYFSQLGGSIAYRGSHGYGGIGYSLAGGVIDIQKQNAGEAVIINTIGSALLSLNNIHGTGNKYTVVNNTGGNLTVGTGGNISTPATITVPAFGSIDLKHIPGTAALSPVV